jgi:hypothetical protein
MPSAYALLQAKEIVNIAAKISSPFEKGLFIFVSYLQRVIATAHARRSLAPSRSV